MAAQASGTAASTGGVKSTPQSVHSGWMATSTRREGMGAGKRESDQRFVTAQLAAATLIGVVTGLVVLALEHLVDDVIRELFEADAWVPAVAV